MKPVSSPFQMLQLLEPRVLGAFMLDYIHALPHESHQRAQVLLADLLTDRGPMLPPGVTPLEQMLSLGTVAAPAAPALQAELQGVADAAVAKAKSKRPAIRAVAQAEGPKAPRTRTSTAEVNSKIRAASVRGHKTCADIAKNTGLGRTTVSAALQRLGGDGSMLTKAGSDALWSGADATADAERELFGDEEPTS